MRHRHGLRKLNRTSSHRLAMLRNMTVSLLRHHHHIEARSFHTINLLLFRTILFRLRTTILLLSSMFHCTAQHHQHRLFHLIYHANVLLHLAHMFQ
jgi:hypothetical protein